MSESEPTDETDGENEPDTATVSEDKFNGTATLKIRASNRTRAETAAKKYFRETHGSKPTSVVAKKDDYRKVLDGEKPRFTVMVANHSSGSLQEGAEYTFD